MEKVLTTYEAASKYSLSACCIRRLLIKKNILGCRARIGQKNVVWLIDESSLKKHLSSKKVTV